MPVTLLIRNRDSVSGFFSRLMLELSIVSGLGHSGALPISQSTNNTSQSRLVSVLLGSPEIQLSMYSADSNLWRLGSYV